MKYYCIDAWDSKEKKQNFYDLVHNDHPDKIIIFSHQEFFYNFLPHSFYNLLELMKTRNKILHVTTGGYLDKYNSMEHSNLKLYHWVDWYFKKVFMTCKWYMKNILKNNINQCNNFEYYKQGLNNNYFTHFLVSLNYRGHRHRCLMIDLLAKNNLLENNNILWHNLIEDWKDVYSWKYFAPRVLTSSSNFGPHWQSPPDEYWTSFAQLISESSSNISFLSEKTVMSLICHKPFLIAGPPLIHQKLKKLGFELFDEIFDYSFDLIEDEEHRYQMLMDNFINLQKNNSLSDLIKLQQKILPKLLFNFNRVLELVNDFSIVPEIVLEVYDVYKTTGVNHNPIMIEILEKVDNKY